jgi:D-arabinose 1-dehydrogenase-like Zn-dependent alcohol dehydrogenase
MKSYALVEYGAALRELEAPTPAPIGTEVLLEVRHSGVCHTDVHLREGYFDLGGGHQLRSNFELPHVLGHEIEGVVVAVGPDVKGIRMGARYAAFPWIGCGQCSACRRGHENICLGVTRQLGCSSGCPGGYGTHVMVPHPRYLIDYGATHPALAAACMCSGLTAYSALQKIGQLEPGDQILIVGCGGVGMMGIQFAKALFNTPPLAADIDTGRREAARAGGACATYDAADPGAPDRIRSDTQGGPVAVVDFVGSEPSFALASKTVRRGGKIIVVGLFGGSMRMPLPLIPLRALAILGSNTGTLEDAKAMMSLVQTGRVAAIPFTHRPLSSADAALNDLKNGAVTGRVVLTPDSDAM